MTNMKPPQEGRNTGAPSLRGLQGRSATGLNGQAAKEEVSALWRGGWMPENISGVPAGRSVFHLTSPLIGLLARGGSQHSSEDCLSQNGLLPIRFDLGWKPIPACRTNIARPNSARDLPTQIPQGFDRQN